MDSVERNEKKGALPVRYKANEEQKSQMERYKNREPKDIIPLKHNWRNEVDIIESFADHKKNLKHC